MRSKPRGLAVLATLCLVAVLAAVMVSAAGDPVLGVITAVGCLAGPPASVRVSFVPAIAAPRDTLFARCVPARGPPLA